MGSVDRPHGGRERGRAGRADIGDRLGDTANDVADLARDTNDHPAVRAMARTGYVASGIVHLLIGWLALRIAWGFSGRRDTADQSGALRTIASQPWGRPLLWIFVAGFAGLAIWQITEAVGGWHGRGREAWGSRGKAVAKAIVYLVLGWTCLAFARGGSSDSGSQSREVTGDLLSRPGGSALVLVVGLVVVGVGAYHVVKGARRRFLADLVRDPGPVATAAGVGGYVAKGIALVIVGGLLCAAGWRGSSAESRGLDGALRTLAGSPFGTWTLTLVALGLAGYALYSFFRARYTKV